MINLQHRCENFTTTNCCPETPARNYQLTLCCSCKGQEEIGGNPSPVEAVADEH